MGLESVGRGWPGGALLALVPRAAARDETAMDSPKSYAGAHDAELVHWTAGGDRQAFGEIVTRHGPFALRVAVRLVGDPHAAEDLVQEAMVRAWSQARHFDPTRARFATWLYRIVVNLCIDHCRRVRPEPLPDNFDPVDTSPGAEETIADDQRRSALMKALAELPVRQRAAMTLVYDEGMSGAEAARVLGVSVKAVERLLARARAFLRERLTPEYGGKEIGR